MDKIIWTYWHQGFEDAPIIVKKCTQQMQRLHPDWQIQMLDKNSVSKYVNEALIDKSKLNRLSLQIKSDVLRTQLLIRYGGVWADPTIYFLKPLDTWLPNSMTSGLFLFHRPGPDRIISSWFIAAEKNCKLLRKLYKVFCNYWEKHNFTNLGRKEQSKIEYWANRIINGRSLELSQIWFTPIFTRLLRLYPYMVYHYMFYRILKYDERCAQLFQEIPKISADGPHRLQRLGLLNELVPETKKIINQKKVPLFKLKWNLNGKEIPESSNLGYLFRE